MRRTDPTTAPPSRETTRHRNKQNQHSKDARTSICGFRNDDIGIGQAFVKVIHDQAIGLVFGFSSFLSALTAIFTTNRQVQVFAFVPLLSGCIHREILLAGRLLARENGLSRPSVDIRLRNFQAVL